MLGPGFCALAAARAAATLAAAADGLTAAVEEVTLLAVDDVGLVVSELLDLLNPELVSYRSRACRALTIYVKVTINYNLSKLINKMKLNK